MRRYGLTIITTGFLVGLLAAQAPNAVTVFEGARLIVGDGSAPIENSAFVVNGNRFTQVGRGGQVQVPAGARRVDLRGKTVMPAIIDTHTHLATNREMLVDQLQRKAYYGVGAAMSLGQDNTDVAFQVRAETIPNAALFRTAGRGITMPEPGRTDAPYWISTVAEGRKAVQELSARKVDLVKIWVDEMPAIPLAQQPSLIVFNTAHFTNWPTADNNYIQPPGHWEHFLRQLVEIKAAE